MQGTHHDAKTSITSTFPSRSDGGPPLVQPSTSIGGRLASDSAELQPVETTNVEAINIETMTAVLMRNRFLLIMGYLAEQVRMPRNLSHLG